MAQIIWTEPALLDLNEIAEYIALDNYSAAQNLVTQVFASVARLEEFPESGRKPPELENMEYREIISNPCRIFYRIDKNKIYVIYVMRSERALRNFIINDRANKIS
ncbi:MAG: type II toxin-antitoxin system RelE/ParE family toxin [Gammaproteobacteria bacterium]|nr:type II toxin-antitoxin system RelE/ParE family toxin [Gammaproteobacteria bacterium]